MAKEEEEQSETKKRKKFSFYISQFILDTASSFVFSGRYRYRCHYRHVCSSFKGDMNF